MLKSVITIATLTILVSPAIAEPAAPKPAPGASIGNTGAWCIQVKGEVTGNAFFECYETPDPQPVAANVKPEGRRR